MSEDEQISGSEVDEDEEEPITEATEAPIPEPEVVADEPVDAPPAEEKEGGDEGEGGDDEVDDTTSEAPQDSLAPEEERKVRRSIVPEEPDPTTLTEAQVAILEAKKRQQEADELRAMDADSRRKAELQHIEEELVALKQRQEERRREREADQIKEDERRKEEDQKRKADELARKERMEAEKNRRAEEKIKRQQQAGSFAGFGEKNDGRNFTVGVGDKSKLEGEKKKQTGLSKEQKEELKRNYMTTVNKPVDVSNLLPNDIKTKIKQVHARLVKLEGEKYDLEKRSGMQEYDLKELNERESQRARNKALAAGVELEQESSGKTRPPKVNVASKFDRQVDRRSYTDKYTLFENPVVRPPPSIVRGSGRPPPDWGRKQIDEIEALRKVIEPPKYVEIVKAEGDAAKPPVEVIPMQIPTEEFDESLAQKETSKPSKTFGDENTAGQNGPTSPSGGDTELEITEEPVDA